MEQRQAQRHRPVRALEWRHLYGCAALGRGCGTHARRATAGPRRSLCPAADHPPPAAGATPPGGPVSRPRPAPGMWKDDTRHGEGEMAYKNGTKYIGNWKSGARDGNGRYVLEDGSVYDGQWKADQRNGKGVPGRRGREEKRRGEAPPPPLPSSAPPPPPHPPLQGSF